MFIKGQLYSLSWSSYKIRVSKSEQYEQERFTCTNINKESKSLFTASQIRTVTRIIVYIAITNVMFYISNNATVGLE
jgi:hypothetical protein